MYRFLNIAFVLAFSIVGFAFAGDLDSETLTVTTGTNAAAAVSDSARITGYIEAIEIDITEAGSTGNVAVVIDPVLSTMSQKLIYTNNACSVDTFKYVRFDASDSAGNALTSDQPIRLLSIGDNVTFTVDGANATSRTFNAVIKFSKK